MYGYERYLWNINSLKGNKCYISSTLFIFLSFNKSVTTETFFVCVAMATFNKIDYKIFYLTTHDVMHDSSSIPQQKLVFVLGRTHDYDYLF